MLAACENFPASGGTTKYAKYTKEALQGAPLSAWSQYFAVALSFVWSWLGQVRKFET